MRDPATDLSSLEALRRLLLTILMFGLVGITLELFLIGHTKDWWEWSPIVLLFVAMLTVAAFWLRPTRLTTRALQTTMAMFFLSGVAGLYLHYRGNVEFELEMYPTLSGLALMREALTGATPALAPGTMLLLSLLGLAVTFRHPALEP